MSEFADALARILSRELFVARRDPERMGAVLERLTASLALTLSVAGGGDARQVSTLLEGAIAYLSESATKCSGVVAHVPPAPFS